MNERPRVVIVTGAGGGIGRAAVTAFRAAGDRVLAADRDPVRLPPRDGDLEPFEADCTDADACERMVARARERWGGVGAVFHVAGISGRRFGDGPTHLCTDEGWDAVLDTNLKGTFVVCRAVIPELMAAGGGAIVNLASVLGMVGGGALFATHAYAASKAGIIGLTRAIATYYAPHGIRANVLAPGLTDTPMAGRALADEATAAHVRDRQPLTAGPVTPSQVAAAAVFLASAAAAGITGAVLPVDGGWTAG